MKVMLDAGAKMPQRAHKTDAGLDICSREKKLIRAGESAIFDTGVHVQIPPGYAGLLVSKSGLNVKHGITSTGLIDTGYTGSIRVKLYNQANRDYTVSVGDKISQLVLIKISTEDVERVDYLEDTERGNGGFGSTGK